MLDRWQYAWDKFNEFVLNEFTDGDITEEEMERRLDHAESNNDPDVLVEYARSFGYKIKLPKE